MPSDPRAALPQVEALVASWRDAASDPDLDHDVAVAVARDVLDDLRAEVEAGGHEAPSELADLGQTRLTEQLSALMAPPRRAINATGVVLHTGLGRAPLGPAARAAVAAAAGSYAVELDADGRRGHRDAQPAALVRALTGAADATFANNGAGALVLALRAAVGHGAGQAGGRVAVSRGELVEIGGSFRIPDIVAAAGVELVEVGTTNRTHLRDVHAALDDGVDAVLVVHPSNFHQLGFVSSPDLARVAAACRAHDAVLVHDVGSGVLRFGAPAVVAQEPHVVGSLAAGADLVTGSGDKLLGGPQAGLLAGRADLVAAARKDPLARALRLDKLRTAALVATLQVHCRPCQQTPTTAMLTADHDELRDRAHALARHLDGHVSVDVVDTASRVGGGSAPDASLASVALALAAPLAQRLRAGHPPVLGRVHHDRLLLDLRTVDPDDDDDMAAAILAAAGS